MVAAVCPCSHAAPDCGQENRSSRAKPHPVSPTPFIGRQRWLERFRDLLRRRVVEVGGRGDLYGLHEVLRGANAEPAEIIESADQLPRRFRESADFTTRRQCAMASVDKGITIGQHRDPARLDACPRACEGDHDAAG